MIQYLWKKWIREYKTENKLFNLFWNIIKFPRNFFKFVKEFCFFIKHGYPYEAVYDHFFYFQEHISKILKDYLEVHNSYLYGMTNEEWENIIKEMIECLDNCYGSKSKNREYEYDVGAKNRFFELYSKYFFNLWD